ncbi:MAG: 4-hydroxythreonine-4-phosphate dehydrogenase PdxA [Acidobacteria bacterium]|nr:4-hydroxythreonine-4-phosphate dehydrogenase PdxA [Acidobacteriota bacterium]
MGDRPVIGITMGDAAGIGPEIVLKALAEPEVSAGARSIVIGDRAFLEREAKKFAIRLRLVPMGSEGGIEVLDLNNLSGDVPVGVNDAVAGRASGQYIEKAVELWRSKEINAIATAPINKSSLNAGGYDFPGHTEFLAKLTDTGEFRMSFFADQLRVVLLSTHLPLSGAIELVSRENIVRLIEFSDRTLSKLLGRKVSIAVAGLNPHASEGGMFGSEEQKEISPAIDECRSTGINVSGPYSPDTIFLRGHRGEFDVVAALYHDQATIPVKSLSFGSAVNVTLGLPLIRTSVDHGTAFDIAGKGIADTSSMKAAIRLAAELAANRS